MKRKSGNRFTLPRHTNIISIAFYTTSFLFFSRIKSQYDAELQDMERAERQSREKYTESRLKMAENEANIQNLHATVKQLEIQLSHSQRVSSKF